MFDWKTKKLEIREKCFARTYSTRNIENIFLLRIDSADGNFKSISKHGTSTNTSVKTNDYLLTKVEHGCIDLCATRIEPIVIKIIQIVI